MTDAAQVEAAVKADAPKVEAAVKADVSKFAVEVAFVKANWVRLSAVVIVAAAIGVALGHFVL